MIWSWTAEVNPAYRCKSGPILNRQNFHRRVSDQTHEAPNILSSLQCHHDNAHCLSHGQLICQPERITENNNIKEKLKLISKVSQMILQLVPNWCNCTWCNQKHMPQWKMQFLRNYPAVHYQFSTTVQVSLPWHYKSTKFSHPVAINEQLFAIQLGKRKVSVMELIYWSLRTLLQQDY